jgi:hypothetical protein
VEEWRDFQARENHRWALAGKQAARKQLEEDIESRYRRYLARRSRLAAHTWRRIETYWNRLMQVHLDGEELNEAINEWRPEHLGGPLQQLIEFGDQLNRTDQSRKAIESWESD